MHFESSSRSAVLGSCALRVRDTCSRLRFRPRSQVQAILEVPLFQVAAKIIRRMGFQTTMYTCMAASAVRFFGYVIMPQMLLVLPFEVCHGYTFAMWYTTMSLYSEEFAGRGLQATILGEG